MSAEASAQALAIVAKISGLPHITGHGLRHSFTTLAIHLGLSHAIKEKLLHHQPKSVLGRHYDMCEYRTEKHHAVQGIADLFKSKEADYPHKIGQWTDVEDELLKRSAAKGDDLEIIAQTVGRSTPSISRRLNTLTVRKQIAETTRRFKTGKPKTNSCVICTALTANTRYCAKSCASKARWVDIIAGRQQGS